MGNEQIESAVEGAPLVSIIMNCYNGERYLREAIDSVLAQTYQNWELVFWDNQSTDQSAEIVASYDDPRIKYHYADEHTVLYAARRSAIERASGDYYAFLDVDDWWSESKIEQQVECFQKSDVGFVFGNYWVVNDEGDAQRVALPTEMPEGYITSDLAKNYYVGMLTLMISRSAYQLLDQGFDSAFRVIGDFDLVMRLSLKCKAGYLGDPLASYRWHGRNESIVNMQSEIDEFSIWLDRAEQGGDFSNAAIADVKQRYYYNKVIYMASNKKRLSLWGVIFAMRNDAMKAKAILRALLPTRVINYLSGYPLPTP